MEKRTKQNKREITVRTGDLGNRILSASDISTALDFVKQKHTDGTYQFFRGQEKSDWLPIPSFWRLVDEAQQHSTLKRLDLFNGYTREASQSCGISYSGDEIIAIAQHYGIPTTFLDLTTDPVVAASFACPPNSEHTLAIASILLYREDDIIKLTERMKHQTGKFVLELIRIDVANLWRLQAQKGLFLHSQVTDICEHYIPDRIEFPHPKGGFVDPNCVLYPPEKSPLETQLDLYFDLESTENSKVAMREIIPHVISTPLSTEHFANTTPRLNVAMKNESEEWVLDEKAFHEKLRSNVYGIENRPLRTLPDSYYHSAWRYRTGELKPHPSWFNELAEAWSTTTVERLEDIQLSDAKVLNVDLTNYGEALPIGDDATEQCAFMVDTSARKKSLMFDIKYLAWRVWKNVAQHDPATKFEERFSLVARNLWDGIRNRPVDNALVGRCMDRFFMLSKHYLDLSMQNRSLAFDEDFGNRNIDHIKVEFSGIGGHSQTARVMCSDLAHAVRGDFDDVIEVNDATGELTGFGFPHLTQMLYPQYLFDFDRFVVLHYLCVLPYQAFVGAITWREHLGFYFNTRQIKVFGMA